MPPRCRCGKVACTSVEEARYFHAIAAVRHGDWSPVRIYVCAYGAHHWTHQLTRTAA